MTEPVGIRWIPSRLHLQPELERFLEFANITEGDPADYYRRFPGMFYPEHCYAKPTDNQTSQLTSRNYTAVAYVEDFNKVEHDVVQ